MTANRRWIKFWPQDWQRDPALRSCGVAARGLWMDMICIAHEGSPYGHVTINGKAATMKQIGSITGAGEKEAARLVSELENAGVFSRLDDGTIFSRRMVRDHEAADAGREAIAKRWEKEVETKKGDDQNPTRDPIRGGDSLEERSKKKEEREGSLRSPSSRGTRLAADWAPGDEGWAFAVSCGLDPNDILARFRDYWTGAPGQKGVKLDWPATWRNWCRDKQDRRTSSPRYEKRKTPGEQWAERLGIVPDDQTQEFDLEGFAE